jgi:putative ABC transport system permease protein
MLLKKHGFTFVAVITLALGIGASAVIFSVVNVVILNPFPYRDHQRLFLVRQSLPKIGVSEQLRASGAEFADLASSPIFEQVAAWEPVSRNLTGSQEPERVAPAKVSAEFFSMLGIEPALAARDPSRRAGAERRARAGHQPQPVAAALRRRPERARQEGGARR